MSWLRSQNPTHFRQESPRGGHCKNPKTLTKGNSMGIESLVSVVVTLIILGCVVGLLLYLVSITPIPEPFKGWLWFVVMAFAVIVLIYVLIGYLPHGGSVRLR